jgi:hypothetical protein
MNELRKVPLNTDRILKLAEEAYSSEAEDGDRYSSHYVEPEQEPEQEQEQQGSPAPADEPAQEPASTPAPEVTQQQANPYEQMWREAMDTNKQLLGLVSERFSSDRTSQPQPQAAPAMGQQAVDPYEQYDPNHLVMHADLAPLHSTLREVQTVTKMFELQVQRQVENEALSAFEEIKKEFPDADQVINRELFTAAVNGAKMQSIAALKQGKEARFPWKQIIMQEYNAADAPRLRERVRKEQEAAEQKAKQQAELDKVSGVPSRGAQYQSADASKTQRKVEPGGDWRSALRSRVNSVVTRFKAD